MSPTHPYYLLDTFATIGGNIGIRIRVISYLIRVSLSLPLYNCTPKPLVAVVSLPASPRSILTDSADLNIDL